jgi:hypothetical protein
MTSTSRHKRKKGGDPSSILAQTAVGSAPNAAAGSTPNAAAAGSQVATPKKRLINRAKEIGPGFLSRVKDQSKPQNPSEQQNPSQKAKIEVLPQGNLQNWPVKNWNRNKSDDDIMDEFGKFFRNLNQKYLQKNYNSLKIQECMFRFFLRLGILIDTDEFRISYSNLFTIDDLINFCLQRMIAQRHQHRDQNVFNCILLFIQYCYINSSIPIPSNRTACNAVPASIPMNWAQFSQDSSSSFDTEKAKIESESVNRVAYVLCSERESSGSKYNTYFDRYLQLEPLLSRYVISPTPTIRFTYNPQKTGTAGRVKYGEITYGPHKITVYTQLPVTSNMKFINRMKHGLAKMKLGVDKNIATGLQYGFVLNQNPSSTTRFKWVKDSENKIRLQCQDPLTTFGQRGGQIIYRDRDPIDLNLQSMPNIVEATMSQKDYGAYLLLFMANVVAYVSKKRYVLRRAQNTN